MARIALAQEIAEDFDRIFEHLERHEVTDIPGRIEEIIEAFDLLEHHPLIGRPAEHDRRELVLGSGSRGYVALYQYIAAADTVIVLAIRSQREAGYPRDLE
jgi:plasmid stabilization system protein ParE